jgi:hypothetical protein
MIEKYAFDVKESKLNTTGNIPTELINKIRRELAAGMFSDYFIDVYKYSDHTTETKLGKAIICLNNPKLTPAQVKNCLEGHRCISSAERYEEN